MGTITIEVGIGDSDRKKWVTLNALVDNGATMTSAPASLLRDLGVEPVTSQRFKFGQGEVRTMQIGYTWVRFAGKQVLTQVLFNEEGSQPLLGAVALENAFMAVDSVGQRLIPVEGMV